MLGPRLGPRPRPRERLISVCWWLVTIARGIVARIGIVALVERRRGMHVDRRGESRGQALVPALLADLAVTYEDGEPATWEPHEVLRASPDLTILSAGPREQPSRAMIKIAESAGAARLLESEYRTLTTLHADPRLGEWRALLPHLIGGGEVGDTWYVAEGALVGTSLALALRETADPASALREAAEVIGFLHRATATEQVNADEALDRWVRVPTRQLAEFIGDGRRSLVDAIALLSGDLCQALEQQRVTVSWVHGDYHAGNILVTPDGRISGIVDWDLAHPQDLPSIDLVTLLLAARARMRHQELGRVVCDVIGGDPWSDWESQLILTAHELPTSSPIPNEAVVLLCWLRHITLTMRKHQRYVDRVVWSRLNVEAVLQAVTHARRASP